MHRKAVRQNEKEISLNNQTYSAALFSTIYFIPSNRLNHGMILFISVCKLSLANEGCTTFISKFNNSTCVVCCTRI